MLTEPQNLDQEEEESSCRKPVYLVFGYRCSVMMVLL